MAKLRNEKYEYIKKAVVNTIIECGIHEIPINPFKICEKKKIKLIKYSEKYTKEEFKKVCDRFPNGFNYFKNNERIIEYNDTLSYERIRTTIFHELGHIILKHSCSCILAETEAEWFGVYMIAPPPLVDLFNIDDYLDLADKFETSLECGYHSMRRYLKWKKVTLIRRDYERDLVKYFIENYNFSNIEVEVMQN